MSVDYLNRIMNSSGRLKGELGNEQEEFRKFVSGEWKSEIEKIDDKEINFLPENNYFVRDAGEKSSYLMKLAADSEPSGKIKNDTYYYVSDDDKFALIVEEKTIDDESSVTASIISENDKDISDCILYCPETNKYFLCNSNKEINLVGYRNFDYQKFLFKLLYPIARIFFRKQNDSEEYTAISSDENYMVSVISDEGGNFSIKLEYKGKRKALVLKSEKFKDFITINNSGILIPKALLESKFELRIY